MLSKWSRSALPTLIALTSIAVSGCGNTDSAKGAPATAGSAAASVGETGAGGSTPTGGTTAAGSGAVAGNSAGGSSAAGRGGVAGVAGESTLANGGRAGTSDGSGSSVGGVTSSGGYMSAAAGSGAMAATIPASDTFDDAALNGSWTVFRPDLADIALADGSLSIVPHSGALWYQASQADLVYKLVTGDFKATTTVHARKASNRMQTPAQFADVGGIMARNPGGSAENYILGVVGYAEMNQLAVEHKSTTNGKSVYGEVAFTPDAEFRMCRQGSTFTIYYRHIGDTTWGPAFDPFERPDLPTTVQVGAIAYTGANGPDFVAIFDDFRFEPLGAGCTQ